MRTKKKVVANWLKMGISGPTGAGKTRTALTIAEALGKDVWLIDSEFHRSRYYGKAFDFTPVYLDGNYSAERYVKAIEEAEDGGCDFLIVDSMTPNWQGTGGILELVDAAAKQDHSGNKFAGWKEGGEACNRLVGRIMGAACHTICTFQAKMEYVLEQVNGKMVPRKKGLAPIHRETTSYAFPMFAEIDADHCLIFAQVLGKGGVTDELREEIWRNPGKELIGKIQEWLEEIE